MCATQLGVGGGETLVLRGGLDRESLRLSVVKAGNPAQRAAWLAAHIDSLPGSGIVYTLTVTQARDVAALLREQGHRVAAYTGATEAAEREQLEADLLANRVKALVATSALGMGFDKPDLGFVVHLGAPSSPIAYYQQVGRAGRSTASAEVILLPGREDQDVWRYFASVAFPSELMVRNVIGALEPDRPQSTPALEPLVDLGRTRLEMVLKVLDVDGAVRRVKGGWIGTGAALGLRRTALPKARRGAQAGTAGDARLSGAPTGAGWPSCAANSTIRNSARASGVAAATTARECASSPDVDAAAAEDTRRAADAARGGARAAQAVAVRAGQARRKHQRKDHRRPRGRPRHRQADRSRMGRAAAAPARRARCRGVRRRRAGRGEGVGLVGLGGPADGGAGAGLGPSSAADLVAGTRAGAAGSADRPRHVAVRARAQARDCGELRLPRRRAERIVAAPDPAVFAAVDGPVLLVDDLSDTGWTLTMAARVVRAAGAPAVLPFALASTN